MLWAFSHALREFCGLGRVFVSGYVLAFGHQAGAHEMRSTLQICGQGNSTIESMIDDLSQSGWKRLMPEHFDIPDAAFHIASVQFWQNVRPDADPLTWVDTFRTTRIRLQRAMERGIFSLSAIPFVSVAGGNNYLLLEYRAVGNHLPSWTCTVALSDEASLFAGGQTGRAPTVARFRQNGVVFHASEVLRSEIAGNVSRQVIVGRMDPQLAAAALGDDRVTSQSTYSVYGNARILNFTPLE